MNFQLIRDASLMIVWEVKNHSAPQQQTKHAENITMLLKLQG